MSKRSAKILKYVYSIEKNVPSFYRIIILSVLFMLVLSFRWNYQDPRILRDIVERPQIIAEKNDIHNYLLLVGHFRKDSIEGTIRTPFKYRIFAPLLASILPLPPLTSLNIVNLAFHLISLFALYRIMVLLKYSSYDQTIGLFLYICSYPLLMFGADGWNEPVSIGFILIGMYYLIKGRRNIVLLIIALGSLNNEKIIILVFFTLVYEWKHKYFTTMATGPFIYIATQVIIRYWSNRFLVNNASIENFPLGYVWFPSIHHIYYNFILRWRNYPSALATFGFVGIGTVIFLKQKLYRVYPEYVPFVFGFYSSMILYIYAITTAVASGRLLWYIYPFSIILTVKMLQHFHNSYDKVICD